MTDYIGSRIPHELRIPCSCGSTQGSDQTVRSNAALHKESPYMLTKSALGAELDHGPGRHDEG